MAGVEFDLHAYHFHMHTARRDFCINDTGYCKNKSVQHIVQMFNLSHLSQHITQSEPSSLKVSL